jgi:perosamine synthetase
MNNTEAIPMLFEPGAEVAPGGIPLSVPHLAGKEWEYIKECLDSNWVSSAGPFVERFERALAAYVDKKHAVAIVNGTAALHIALIVAGIEPDDEVLIPSLTFIAPANAIRYANAWPVFIDVEPKHWQLDVQKLTDFLHNECEWKHGTLRNKTSGRRVRAILPVDILGHPCDMGPILEAAHKVDLKVVEDATESLGGRYKQTKVGNLSDIACFSFNGNKIITTGGGGMIVTNDDRLAEKARYLTTQAKDDPVEYVHNEIGYNYRLTNIQAALGCAQMENLDQFVGRKRAIAAKYKQAFRSVDGLTLPEEASWAYSTFWLYTVRVSADNFGVDSRQLMHTLRGCGIQARPLWQPLHLSKAHQGAQQYRIEAAETINREALSLPSSVGLTNDEQDRVIEVVLTART